MRVQVLNRFLGRVDNQLAKMQITSFLPYLHSVLRQMRCIEHKLY